VVAANRIPLFGEPPAVPLLQPTGVVRASYNFVSPDYFSLLGIQILRGRGFSAEEARQESPVVVVSAAAATKLWPGEDPIGKTLRLNIEPAGTRLQVAETVHDLRKVGDESKHAIVATVVGVATDAVSGFVYIGTDHAHVYLPTSAGGTRADALMVRPRAVGVPMEQLKTILQRAHPDPMAFDLLPLDDIVQLQMFPLRAASGIGSLLSAVALALSISGLYGVLTYTFGQRTQEIGIRLALGASTPAIRQLVFAESLRRAAVGIALGLLTGFTVMKLLSTVVRLDNVSVIDPCAFVISSVLIGSAVGLASYGPARRASRIDPSAMLRADG
jgi:putative ABC transport system permease protein